MNIGSGTQISDLRNDYSEIRVVVNGHSKATGLSKIGAYIGDHSKTSIGTLINSGTVIGAFCNVLATGSFAPKVIPSFCMVRYGQMQERTDMRNVFETAHTVMRRREQELTDTHTDFFFTLYEMTAMQRRRSIQDSDLRRLRRIG